MSDQAGDARIAPGALAIGVVLLVAAQVTLSGAMGLPFLDALMLAFLLVGLPMLAHAQLPAVQAMEIERVPVYWGSIWSLWLVGAACWLLGTREGGVAALGAGPVAPAALLVWAAALTVSALALMVAFRFFGGAVGTHETRLIRDILPRTRRERRLFVVLSLAAGVGEEIAYRGYAIPLLAGSLSPVGAVVVTSVTFGAVHAYQGPLGMLRAGSVGALFGWGFLASGSLWTVVLAHTLVDLIAGLVIGERLLSPEPTSGVRDGVEDIRAEG